MQKMKYIYPNGILGKILSINLKHKNKPIPYFGQAYQNCIEFTSNLLSLSPLIHRDVELYI